jgi:hypothetical protein
LIISRIISEFGVYCGYKSATLSKWAYSRPNLIATPKYTSIDYYIYSDRSQELEDNRPKALQAEIVKYQDPTSKFGARYAAFLNTTGSFAGISKILVIGTVPTDAPRITGTIAIGSGNTWISVQNISLDDNGYLVAGTRRGYIPTYYEVLLDYNRNTTNLNSTLNGTVQNYAEKLTSSGKGSFNFTNLLENSTYYLAVYSKNLDDTFLASPSDPLIIIIETNEQPVVTVMSASTLQVSLASILVCILLVFV